jgi:membrane protease YdiL (CAAX protease family)
MTNKAFVRNADIFFFVAVFLLLPLNFLLIFIQRETGWEITAVANVLISQGYYLACVLIYLLATRQKFREFLRIRKFHLGSAFLAVFLIIVAAPVVVWINLASQLVFVNEIAMTVYDISLSVPYPVGVLMLGVLPGLVEEIICRGVMLNAHSHRSLKAGIIISAIVFACLHMNFNQMAYAFFLGLLFALLVEATGSILSAMMAHALFNAYNVSLVYVLPLLLELQESLSGVAAEMGVGEMIAEGAERSQLGVALLLVTPMAGAGLVLAGILLYLIAKLNHREEIIKSLYKKEYIKDAPVDRSVGLVNPFLIAGIIVCLLVALIGMAG